MIGEAAAHVARAGSVCVLTGSGVSAESGLPTFRGTGGLWRTHRIEMLASPEGFARDPLLVWSWYNERRAVHRAAEPGDGHRALAALESRITDFTIATQNVDSLHQRAGSRQVLELHGSLREARCDSCGARRPFDGAFDATEIAHACPTGGYLRPDIVWFGETLPEKAWSLAVAAAARADVVLVVGTSGMVNPAALLATRVPRADAFLIEVNVEPTVITPFADAHLNGTAGTILPQLLELAFA